MATIDVTIDGRFLEVTTPARVFMNPEAAPGQLRHPRGPVYPGVRSPLELGTGVGAQS